MQDVHLDRYRARLLRLATRYLKSVHDAEDVVQEALFNWHCKGPSNPRNVEAWLVTVVTRACIDRLRSLERDRVRNEKLHRLEKAMPDLWHRHPELALERYDDLGTALASLLAHLNPDQRAAFVMREAFACPYDEIASVLGKREDACRQLVHRAHAALQSCASRETTHVRPGALKRFAGKLRREDRDGTLDVLAEIA